MLAPVGEGEVQMRRSFLLMLAGLTLAGCGDVEKLWKDDDDDDDRRKNNDDDDDNNRGKRNDGRRNNDDDDDDNS
jgi:hypothetical protein